MKRRVIASLVFLAPWTVLVPMAQTPKEVPAPPVERIQKEVRHELLMLPYFGVFDNIAYKVEGYKVTLMGQVTRPTLKSDAGNVVKRIEGVEQVDNQIEVLPPLAHGRPTALGALSSHLRLPGAGALRHAGHQADPDHCEEWPGDSGGRRG